MNTRKQLSWMAAAVLVGVATMAAHAAVAEAPSAAELKAIAGREKKAHLQTTIVSPALTPSESRAMAATIQGLREALLNSPALQTLRGYDWTTFGRVEGHETGRPLKARLGYIAYPYFFNTRMNRAESSAEGAPFNIYVNDPDIVLGNGGYLVDEEARFTFAPASSGSQDGFPTYFAGEHFVVITRDAQPLFVPVTEQRYLEVRIAEERASFSAMKASLTSLPDSPSKTEALSREEGRLTALEKELAGLSAAERGSPALWAEDARTSRAASLAERGASRTRAIVMPNPDLFDGRKPRTAVQMIVLGSVRYQPELFTQVQSQIDKAALLELFN